MTELRRIGIIGGGASGLAAAITAGRLLKAAPHFSMWEIDLFERNSECGKKILATGNGRCNISNMYADDYQICEGFFTDLGILFAADSEGRMYPYAKQAKTVRDTLVEAVRGCSVNLITDTQIKEVSRREGVFVLIDANGKTYEYDKLVITTGGKAGIQYGSDGDGYKFARVLGIETTPIKPALVPMTYGENPKYNLKILKGVRASVELALKISGQLVATEKGEIQFTDYGLSGICIFNLSNYLKDAPRKNGKICDTEIIIDLIPDFTEEDIISVLDGNLPAGLRGMVNEKIEKLFLESGISPEADSIKTAKLLKALPVNINGTKGWKEAQVTSGGISTDKVDSVSMESLDVSNLFFAGEVLDYHGLCGGYNLNWAWSTGIKAGLGVINGIEADD